MFRKTILTLLSTLILLSISACGGGSGESSSSTDTPTNNTGNTGLGDTTLGTGNGSSGLTQIKNLPLATDAVAAGINSNSRAAANNPAGYLPFATAAADDFGNSFQYYVNEGNLSTYFPNDANTSSYAACDLLNYTRGAYASAAESDIMLCLVTAAEGGLQNDDFVVRTMSFNDGNSTENYKIKYRQITDTSGNIKAFELYGCSDNSGSMAQDLYFSQDYSNNNVVMLIKSKSEPDNSDVDSVSMQVDLTATGINNQGQITGTKTMAMRYRNVFSSGVTGHTLADLVLTDDTFLYNGFYCDRQSTSSTTCDANGGGTAFYAHMDILNNNGAGENNLNKFALGDGASYLYRVESDQTVSLNGIQIWDGASGATDNTNLTSNHYNYVYEHQNNVKSISASYTDVTFTTAQTWDCSDSGTQLSVSNAIMMQCVGEKEIDQDVHLECGGGPGGANFSTATVQ